MRQINDSGILVTIFDNASMLLTSEGRELGSWGRAPWGGSPHLIDGNIDLRAGYRTGVYRNVSIYDLQAEVFRELIHQGTVRIQFMVICCFVTLLATFFAFGRLYVRRFVLKQLFIDDWFIVAALVSGVVSYAFFLAALMPQTLWYMWYVGQPILGEAHTPEEPPLSKIRQHIFYLFVNTQGTFGRLSILYTFSRLAVQGLKAVYYIRILVCAVSVLLALATIPAIWLAFDPCWPPTGGRGSGVRHNSPASKGTPGVRCLYDPPVSSTDAINNIFIATAAFNSAADLFCFALPFLIFKVSRIAITKEQRRGLYALFGFGFGVFFISICRCVETTRTKYSSHSPNANKFGYGDYRDGVVYPSPDGETSLPLLIWALGESNAVMVGACLPVIAKPILRFFGRLRRRVDPSVPTNEGKSCTGSDPESTVTGDPKDIDRNSSGSETSV